ncbi:MAG: hypothetical protein GDA39_03530 [Hyphomonadaceae bacterium]|nr:hypothetical protein [Hyphomonadaceae bacterium]MBC6412019.1 hypothetical protein [Hyphomonadaceae bacterium]
MQALSVGLADVIVEALRITKQAGVSVETSGKNSSAQTVELLHKPDWIFGPAMKDVLKIDKNTRSSMLGDLEAGRTAR